MGGNDSRLRLTAAMGALTAVAWAAPVLVLACGSGDGANEAGGGEGRNAPGGNELQAAPADPRAAPTDPQAAPPEGRLFPEVLSVRDAVLHDGVWFVVDIRELRIHRIASDGTYLGSFGGRGEGPGELRGNAGPVAMLGDSVVVRDQWGLHLYDFEGAPVADWRVEDDHCLAPSGVSMDSSPKGLLLVVQCGGRAGVEPRPRVVLAEGRGRARTLVTDTADVNEVRWDRGFPRMAAHPRGFVFGYTGDECLGLFDLEGAPLERICHDWMDRVPFPEEEADEYMRDLAPRARSQGMRVHRPEFYPPFVGFFVAGGENLVYVAQVSEESWHGVRLVTRGRSGGQTNLPIPEGANLFGSGRSVLAAWADLEGTRIQFYTLDLERNAAEPWPAERPR
ncbi:MAG: hypothetical protein OXI45_03885 [Acidobacteriota bacterium]|nr:hypothetical protein [Acidobacteriota bacterium]